MPANNVNTGTLASTTPVYQQFIVNTTGFQNSSNNIYEAKLATVTASREGTLGTAASGQPTFKSDYERMQFLLGKFNRSGDTVGKPLTALGTN
jgi:hypothetical protein